MKGRERERATSRLKRRKRTQYDIVMCIFAIVVLTGLVEKPISNECDFYEIKIKSFAIVYA